MKILQDSIETNNTKKMKHIVLLLTVLLASSCQGQEYAFPDGFMFGVATSSYQVEGAWNVSGKGVNTWDHLTHTNPDFTVDSTNGDVACDSYHNTETDVKLLVDMGVDSYRFSLSWTRILPNGYNTTTNPDGVRYYNELIDTLLANGITPLVTIYHWDLPQILQDNHGGWLSSDLVDIYLNYADTVFSLFGDRVKNWITFNELHISCEFGYSGTMHAPALGMSGVGGYLCAHNILIAHGRTYNLYNEKYRDSQQGRIGIAIDTEWKEPASNSTEDMNAAEQALQMEFGWIANPIFSTSGNYPPIMIQRVAEMSAQEGLNTSRLPSFTDEEIELIQGSADFLALNHYTSSLCSAEGVVASERPSYAADVGVNCYKDPEWETTAAPTFSVTPWGFRNLLRWIKNEYNNPEVIVTENGLGDSTGVLHDCRRVNYYNSYLTELLKAIHEDECNVISYQAWSFMDNFEWSNGYTIKFGIIYVDFEDPDRPRTPKMSSYIYGNIIKTRSIDWDYIPEGFEACTF